MQNCTKGKNILQKRIGLGIAFPLDNHISNATNDKFSLCFEKSIAIPISSMIKESFFLAIVAKFIKTMKEICYEINACIRSINLFYINSIN